MAKRILAMLGLVCLIGLMLVLPAVAVQASDAVIYQQTYRDNPLYPDAPVHTLRVLPDSKVVKKEVVCRDTLQEAAVDLRTGLKNRAETVTVAFMAPGYEAELMDQLFDAAVSHTGKPTEGDYICWHYQRWSASMSSRAQGGQYRNEVTFTIAYLSTADQEKELDIAVQKLLDQLDVYEVGDYEKVSAIYDYICENVEYDHLGVQTGLAHTAYAALINGKAVCQGYASLFYRLALALDVDNRVITGIGNGGAHGWNIVKLDGRYYNLDSTWDATRKQNHQPYEYYLRCDASFPDHTRDDSYLTKEFQKTYLMAQEDYVQRPQVMPGDLDGNACVTEDDAIYLLQSVLMPEFFPLDQAVDYSRDGKVSEDDAIYLLQHVLMPDFFPL